MLVYVDDIVLTGNNSNAIDRVIKSLGQTFAIKDLGPLSYFLGIEVVRKQKDLVLSQKKYIWNCFNGKISLTPNQYRLPSLPLLI